jgi:anti-sigma regulatory factor (Ser/Thr protein kinase)
VTAAPARILARPESVAYARSITAGILDGDPRCDDAVAIVSELVTNSVRHSRSRNGGVLDLLVDPGPGVVHIEVRDAGPAPRTRRPDGVGGMGLAIVEALADKWDSEIGFDHGVYWAELA